MDRYFGDIDIPARAEQEEISVPLDLKINFAYQREEHRLCLEILSVMKPLRYDGGGRISDGESFFKLAPLKILDPFLSAKKYIYGKYMKIFLRVLLPKLKRDGLKVSCGLWIADRPAVSVDVRLVFGGTVKYDVAWNADPADLREIIGLTGFLETDGVLYQGTFESVRKIPQQNGSYSLSGNDAVEFASLAENMPAFFTGSGMPYLRMLSRRPAKRVPERPPRDEGKTAEAEVDIPAKEINQPEPRVFDGPVLISATIRPHPPAGGDRFVKFAADAKRFDGYRHEKTDYRPFSAYWPTYESMTKDRRDWYFYWRSEFLNGNALKTDISYLYVALYECVNISCGDAETAYDRMVSIWKAYRGDYPVLDRYVPGWCFDFILINRLDRKLADAFGGLTLDSAIFMPVPEVYFEDCLRDGLSALPLELFDLFSTYSPCRSRFFAGHEALVREGVKNALRGLEVLIKKVKGKTLLECFEPEPKKYIYVSYRSAVCGKAASKRIELAYRPYSRSVALKSFVGDVLRHTENLLRKKARYPGRLRCGTLRPEIAAAVERALNTPAAVSEKAAAESVSVDLEKALALEADSWENTKKLIEAAGGAEELSTEPEADPEKPEPPLPTQNGDEKDEDGDPWGMFAGSLSELERRMLEALLRGASVEELSRTAGEAFTFPETVFGEINSRFSDLFCDVLVNLSPEPEIIDDYREDIAAALDI